MERNRNRESTVIKFSGRRLLTLAGGALLVGSLAACEDDDGVTPIVVGVPSGIAAAATSSTTARVTWNQVAGADSYEIDRAAGTGAFANVRTGLTSTFFEDTGLTAGTQYRYIVRAVQGTNKSQNSTEASV